MTKPALSLLLLWATAAHALPYQLIELPPISGSSTTTPTGAYDVSESGYVAGSSGAGSGRRAVRWQPSTGGAGAPVNLGVLSPATWSVAYGVNDHGHVVGSSGFQAFIWRPLTTPPLQPIPKPPGAPASARCVEARDVNVYDQVVGLYSPSASGGGFVYPAFAFRWTPGGATAVSGGPYVSTRGSIAHAINGFGTFVGAAEVEPQGSVMLSQQAYTWDPEHLIGALSVPEGSGQGVAYGINGVDQVVGWTEGQAFLWSPSGGTTLLGSGTATDINDLGEIVGHTSQFAWVKLPASPVQNLNALIPANSGWTLLEAHAINNAGWIVGVGRKTVPSSGGGLGSGADEGSSGTTTILRGFLLIPQ